MQIDLNGFLTIGAADLGAASCGAAQSVKKVVGLGELQIEDTFIADYTGPQEAVSSRRNEPFQEGRKTKRSAFLSSVLNESVCCMRALFEPLVEDLASRYRTETKPASFIRSAVIIQFPNLFDTVTTLLSKASIRRAIAVLVRRIPSLFTGNRPYGQMVMTSKTQFWQSIPFGGE